MAIRTWWLLTLASSLILIASIPAFAGLDDNLRFMTPLIGIDWVGGYRGEDAPDVKITLRFDPILDGRVVRYTREAPNADYSSVTHIFWDPQLEQVRFLSLDNRGIVGEGTVIVDGDEIRFQGEGHQQVREVEFKTVMSLVGSGTLRDVFWRKEKDGWVQGHRQEFRDVN